MQPQAACPDESHIAAFADGTASADVRASIERHIARCDDCRELLSMLARQRPGAPRGVAPPPPTSTPAGKLRADDEARTMLHAPTALETPRARAGAPRRASEPSELDLDSTSEPTRVEARPAPPDRLLPGTLVNDTYVIERCIGEGGMGLVYEATHHRLHRAFALKVIARRFVRSEEARARFEREALVSSRLSHPNIVDVIDFDHLEDGTPYLVMELLQGEDLSRVLAREAPLPELAAALLVDQIAAGLDSAHAANVVHRDLKPSNVFLCEGGPADPGRTLPPTIKLLDFGLSKVLDDAPTLTMSDATLGTAWYMAPEQADRDFRNVGPRSDVFALGVITYEMLTGKRPFQGRSIPQVLYAVVHEEPTPLSRYRPEISVALETVVSRALAKRPAERPSTAGAFARALYDAARGIAPEQAPLTAGAAPATDRVEGAPPLGGEHELPPVKPRRRRASVLAAVAVLVVSAVTIALALTWPAKKSVAPAAGSSAGASSTQASANPAAGGGARAGSAAVAADGRAGAAAASSSSSRSAHSASAAPPAGADGGTTSTPTTARAAARARARVRARRRRQRLRRRARGRYGALWIQSKSAADGQPLWASVTLDGRPVGRTALNLPRVRAGRHRIVVSRAGYRTVRRRVNVRAGQRRKVRVILRKK